MRDAIASADMSIDSRVECNRCGEKGHTKVRCRNPPKEVTEQGDGGDGSGDANGFGVVNGFNDANGFDNANGAAGGADWGTAAPVESSW